jgi:hypothetical protein
MKLRSGIWLDPISMEIFILDGQNFEFPDGGYSIIPSFWTNKNMNSLGFYFVGKL